MAFFATLQDARAASIHSMMSSIVTSMSGKRLNAAAYPPALPHWLRQLRQQPFAPQPAAVAAQLAVLVDHAMTRNQNRDPVAPVGGAHRARCSGTSYRPRQFL